MQVPEYKQSNSFRKVTLLVFIVYALILFKLVLFKRSPSYYKHHFTHNYSMKMVKKNINTANYTPFATIVLFAKSRLHTGDIVANIVGNIVGFIPLGILLPILFRRFSSPQKVILAGFLLSLGFEIIQLLTVLGNFDVDDLMLNTCGTALGYFIFWLERTYNRKKEIS
jgi:glycopeptide antibiotics resistance protein